jgi:GNAT superfamily N-acetyltransferase
MLETCTGETGGDDGGGMTEPVHAHDLRIVPANHASWQDLEAIFGTADYPFYCQCQRFKVTGWLWRDTSLDERLAMQQASGVWAVTCFCVRKGYRGRGITYALAEAAAAYANEQGATAVEGYAMVTQPGVEITWGELHCGAAQVFGDAGFTEVSAPTKRRRVMRIDFAG